MFAENLFGLGFLVVCFLCKINPNPRKNINYLAKSGPSATFNLRVTFLGLGWPWVGEFAGFILICICFIANTVL